jgi:hypothetical protein
MVTSQAASAGQVAPAGLEPVRDLLNSWLIPNDSRVPADTFADYAGDQGWRGREAALVRELRDEIRRAVENGEPAGLNPWIGRLGLRPAIGSNGMGPEHGVGSEHRVCYEHGAGAAGDILAAVLQAITDSTWRRLKACPDCHWVFYDHTRNGSKRWCLMYAGGPDGRACGTIAKVRRYRERWGTADAAG